MNEYKYAEYAEILRAIADGKGIQERPDGALGWVPSTPQAFFNCMSGLHINYKHFRVAPDTITDDKENFDPENGEVFDLERALAGEPVKLRGGRKAWVRHKEDNLNVTFPLSGYIMDECERVFPTRWRTDGKSYLCGKPTHADIIGMWPNTIMIGDNEVPEPARNPLEVGQTYYLVNPVIFDRDIRLSTLKWNSDSINLERLKAGLIQLTPEGWRKHCEALIEVSGGKL